MPTARTDAAALVGAIAPEALARACAEATSLKALLELLALPEGAAVRRHLTQRCQREGLTVRRHGKGAGLSAEEIAEACASARTRADVLRHLGLSLGPASYLKLEQAAAAAGLVLDLPEDRGSRDDFDEARVRELATTAGTRKAILVALGYAGTNKELAALGRFADAAGITLPPMNARGTGVFADRAAVAEALGSASGLTDALDRLGVSRGTDNRDRLRRAAERFGLDLPVEQPTYGGVPLTEILRAGVEIKNQSAFKKKLVAAGLLAEECADCGLGPQWRTRPLTLQLDHVNGDRLDNRLENLRLLCPNCHSQTDTFAARNSVRRKETSDPAAA